MAKNGKTRTVQITVKSDDEEAVAAFVNAARFMAVAAFGDENQSMVFAGTGVKKLRASLDSATWHSANVKGRMRGQ